MSRIDDLIAEHCPTGVEYRTLGEVCTVLNGFAFKSSLFNSVGLGLPIIRIRDVNTGFSDTFYSGEYDQKWLVSNGDILIGMDGDFRATRWKHGRGLLNQRVCRLQDFSQEVVADYLFYQVQDELDRIHASITGSTVKHLSSQELQRSRIPVPPLEVQREIVRILDTFTELEAELEAELDARRQQYANYKRLLLARASEAPKAVLSDVAEFENAKAHERFVDPEGSVALLTARFISTNGEKARYVHPGDVRTPARAGDVALVMSDLPNGRALARTFFVDLDGKYAANQRVCLLRPRDPARLSSKYLFYVMNRHPQLLAYDTGVDQTHLKRAYIEGVVFGLPSREEQDQIVQRLDALDALVNDLSVGLPAELTARRQQYEYYRDRLLTFEEAPA